MIAATVVGVEVVAVRALCLPTKSVSEKIQSKTNPTSVTRSHQVWQYMRRLFSSRLGASVLKGFTLLLLMGSNSLSLSKHNIDQTKFQINPINYQ